MANRQSSTRRWGLAVLVSLFLHGAVLLGFSLVSSRQTAGARASSVPVCLSFASLEDDDPGEVRFVGSPAAAGSDAPRHQNEPTRPSPDADPVEASLREPWAVGASGVPSTSDGPGEDSSSGVSGAGARFFQVAVKGQRLVYLLDGSASMGKKDALTIASRELVHSLKQLPASARFQVIIYNHQPQYLLPRSLHRWLAPTADVIIDVAAALAMRTPEGGTDHDLALLEAFRLVPCPDMVFLLTDADDLRPEHVQRLNSLNQGRAVVHTIELSTRHRGQPEMPLQRMASENGGTYQAVELER